MGCTFPVALAVKVCDVLKYTECSVSEREKREREREREREGGGGGGTERDISVSYRIQVV